VPSEEPSSSYGAESATREQASLLAVLRRRAPIIILVTILSAGAAGLFVYAAGPNYESTAKLFFRQTIGPEADALGLIPGSPDADNLANANLELVRSQRVAEASAAELRRDGWEISPEKVRDDVRVSTERDSDVVSVRAQADSRERAALLATTYAGTAARQAEADQTALTLRALRSVNRQLRGMSPEVRSNEGGRLRSHRERLRTLLDTGVGRAKVIQRGYVPESRAGNPAQTIVLGALFGLILGCGLALVREQADRRLRHAQDVSAVFDAPVLTTVPRNRRLKRHAPFTELPPDAAEAFRILQTNLRFGQDPPVRTVLITSARRGEGKTTVAWNLACAAASAGLSVAFIEGDMRRSSIAERYGLKSQPGLSEALEGEVAVSRALQPVLPEPEETRVNGHLRPVHVLVAGHPAPDPWRLMQSSAVGSVLEVVERDHDLVVIDTPPISHVGDAMSLLGRVDGVIVTASVNSTRGPEAERLRYQLQALGARVLGVVANGGSAESGYAYAPAAKPSTPSSADTTDGSGAPTGKPDRA
jgi:polysaccharide biosynthesis transport protein